MLKLVAFVVAGAIAFVIAFSWVNKDEIMSEAATRMAEDFVAKCTARAQFPPEVSHRAEEICGCMK